MEQITVENLNFSYPLADRNAVDGVSLKVESGEFILLCGASGSGKTTLLKQLKKELAPHGKRSGDILIDGRNIDSLTLRESAEKTGFVMQDPETQTVTDSVWHELAFGLENLGLSTDEIRLRTAETAEYFGINGWFGKRTAELSGGQKQILALASVMIMQPDILLLDEPTSQLDPVAAENLLSAVGRLNRELGTTVIMTEQRLEEAFAYAGRVLVMDGGTIVFDGTPEDAGAELSRLPPFMKLAAPAAARIYSGCGFTGKCPVTVCGGRNMLQKALCKKELPPPGKEPKKRTAIELKDICFRYEKNGGDVLKNLSLKIPGGCFFAVLGGNGTGKTTLLKIISGTLSPYGGKVKIYGESRKKSVARTAFLPQEVKAVFAGKTVLADLEDITPDRKKIDETARFLRIGNLLDRHPFDLSGGEQQRAALAKALLSEPDILLLDEPTKGMDAGSKAEFARIAAALTEQGRTVIMISHDVEFCAKYAGMCAMLFDGGIVSAAPAKSFFTANRFYTTAAARMARGIIKNAVTDEDIMQCLTEKPFRS